MSEQLKIKPVNNLVLPIKYIAALVAGLIILLTSGWVYYRQLRVSLDSNYHSSIKSIAQSRNRKIDIWNNHWLGKLKELSSDSSITHFINLGLNTNSYKNLRDKIENQLKHYSDDNDFGALEIINNAGTIVYSSGVKLSDKSIRINSGYNVTKHKTLIDSTYFLCTSDQEIRFVVYANLTESNETTGSVYAEINLDAAFGNSLNNIIFKEKSDVDIYYFDGIRINSLRKNIYEKVYVGSNMSPDHFLKITDLFWLPENKGLVSFKDQDHHTQFAYVLENTNTGWIILARDKIKEHYAYLIHDLSDYLNYGLVSILLLVVLLTILWKKVLLIYSSAVKSRFENIDLQARFDHFSKFSHDIFFLLDKAGNIVDFNEKAFTTYGYTMEEFGELNVRDLRILKDRNKTDEYFKTADSSSGIVFDTVHRKKDKTLFEVEVSMKQVSLNGVKLIQSIVRDVSERINIERKLKEHEKLFQLIAQNLDEVFYSALLKPQRSFEFISPSIEDLTGYKPKYFYEDPALIIKILHPDDRYRVQHLVEGKLEEKRPPARLIKKDGSIIWVLHRSIERKNSNNETIGFVGIIKDVTDKLKSELRLKETEESFKYLFENNPLPMWLYNLDTKRFINPNNAALKLYGYSYQEILDLRYSDIRMDNKDSLLNEYNTGGAQFLNHAREELHRTSSGSKIYVEVYSHPFQINGDGTSVVLEVIKDITKRKVAEEKILESEQRFKTLAKISPVAIFRTNNRGELTYVNENWTKMTGVYPELAFGRKWWLGLPIKDKDLTEISWKRSTSLSNTYETELHFANSKSAYKWVLASTVKIQAGENNVIGYIGTLTDITKLKLFEDNFRKLYYSVEQSPVSIVITDTKGKIEYVNPAVVSSTGYSKEELLGNNPSILKSGFQDKHFYSNLWSTISSGQTWYGEFYNKRKDGDYYWEKASVSPVLNERGEITNYVAVKEDVTLLKKMKDELVKAKNEAIESEKIKTIFLQKINLELRSPLVGIMGVAETIFDEADNSRLKELGTYLLSDSKKLNESLKSILAFSNLDTEQIPPKIEAIEICTIINKVVNKFLSIAKSKNIALITNDISFEIYVRGNEIFLNDIITNLLDNATKFTNKGSVTLSCKISDTEFLLIVKDTGIGIPENKSKSIFDPFVKIDDTNIHSGVGLGLTLAKRFTESLGGKLWFESSDAGSTFYLSLRLADAPITLAKETSNTPKDKRSKDVKKKVLLIEDDEINSKVTSSYLKNIYDVTSVSNSSEALKIIDSTNFDAILMDIGLKDGLNGIELTGIIRTDPRYKNMPIIAVTAFTLTQDREKIMAAGCSHYIAKPFVKNDLLNLLAAALR